MVMAGVRLEIVQKLLRHRNITTTQRYAHLSPEFMRDAVGKLDARLCSDTKSDTPPETKETPDCVEIPKKTSAKKRYS
jgi:hypothetical protein